MTSHTIATILDTLPSSIQKNVIKSLGGSLNSSIIGYTRSHIRQSRYENVSRELQGDEVPTIDRFNDSRAEADERLAAALAMQDAGVAPSNDLPPLTIAHHLSFIRAHFSEELLAKASHPRDVLLSIPETLAFQISRSPQVDEAALRKLIEVLELETTVEELAAIKRKDHMRDHQELLDMRGQILDTIGSFSHNIDADTDAEVEHTFDQLPAPIQYRLVVSIGKALQNVGKQALSRIMRGQLDAAGDTKLIAPVIEDCRDWLQEIYRKYSADLDAFTERGGSLPELS